MSGHDSSDNEESQASQLLQTMLNPGDDDRQIDDIGQGDDPDLTKGSTTDSSPFRTSISFHYDFHGLGQTQTQYLDEELDVNESSQKENIGTGKKERLKMTGTIASSTPYTGSSSSGATKPRSVAVKAVSFQSPQKKSTPPPTTNHSALRQPTRPTTFANTAATSRKRIGSPISSQDSFGVLDQDPGQQFLATSKQFNVPLSELPKVVLPPAAVPSARSSPSSMYSSKHHQRRYRRSLSPPEGTVLVESTPSASGGSQSQHTQSYPEAQPTETLPDQPNSQSDAIEADHPLDDTEGPAHLPIEECFSDAPSSFYADHNDESFPSAALAPTQPSTQVEDNEAMDVDPAHPFDAVHEANVDTGTTSSTATTHPRSLLSMVDPKKRYRYQHLLQAHHKLVTESPSARPDDEPPSMPSTRRSPTPNLALSPRLQGHSEMLVETQPSLDEDLPKPVQRRSPGSSQSANNKPFLSHSRDEPLRCEEVQSRETDVLESENPQDEVSKGKIAMRKAGRSSINNPHSGNVVEESGVRDTRLPSELASSFPKSDDEEDVPLSKAVRERPLAVDPKEKGKALHDSVNDDISKKSGSRQGKRSIAGRPNRQVTSVPPIPPLDVPAPTSNVRTTRASAALPVHQPPAAVPSWQSGIVPSSIPNENAGDTGVKSHVNTGASKRGKKLASTTQARAKPRRTPAVPAKRTRRRAELNAENSSLSASDDELLIQAGGNEDDSSEPADDVDMDPDFAGGTSKKRKRNDPPAKSTKTKSRSSKRVKKAAASTPSNRQTKQLRSVASGSRISEVASTRVFALWKRDSCYYAGTVHSDLGGGMYEIHFDDKSTADVHIDQMRLLDLRVNDDVMIPHIMRGFKVTAVDKLASSHLVSVLLDEGIEEMELSSVRIAAKTISVTWQDRTLSRYTIIPTIKPEPNKASPAPSGFSMASVPSRRSGRSYVFEKTAFVVSASSIEGNWEKEKENLWSKIKSNGGIIVDDWSDVILMEGHYGRSNHRWVIEKGEARWIGAEGIARIFLVADQPSYKPKFLLALALGVPCLKVEWLYDTVTAGEEKDWLAYILGQGYSEELSTEISQQIDINWGTSVHHLNDIMENKVPCKLFSGKSILCIGDLVPKTKNKKSSVAHNAITRIILAMGADRVEAVTAVNHASAPVDKFDFVVIKKAEDYSLELGMVPEKTVHWNWVKECLIASRLLPQPAWGLESQEA